MSYKEGTGYIETFAMALVADGTHTAEEAVKIAREAWAKHQAAKKAVQEAMNNDLV